MTERNEALLNAPEEGATAANESEEGRDALLAALGERVRSLRARRGLTRKAVALAAGVSERHLANLEYGIGNASILVLQQVAGALHCSLAELVGDVTTSSPEWLLIRELLEHRSEADLRRVRIAIGELLGTAAVDPLRHRRIALVGLRGAGKVIHDEEVAGLSFDGGLAGAIKAAIALLEATFGESEPARPQPPPEA